MADLKALRQECREICYALAEDEAETAQEYLMGMRPEVLALFTAHCLTIILQVAMLNDYEIGDFSGTSR